MYLEERADKILMSTRQDRKSFLVGDEDAGWHNKGLDWLASPTLNLLFRRQVGGQLKNKSNLPAAVTESSETVPPTTQDHFHDYVQHSSTKCLKVKQDIRNSVSHSRVTIPHSVSFLNQATCCGELVSV